MFIKTGGSVKELSYEEASAFDAISAQIVMENYESQGYSSVSGTISSVTQDASGICTACTVKDAQGDETSFGIRETDIIDATGSGWRIVHEGDGVRVFCEGEGESRKAVTLFILSSAAPLG